MVASARKIRNPYLRDKAYLLSALSPFATIGATLTQDGRRRRTGLCSTKARPSSCRTTRLATNSSLSVAVASSWRSLHCTRVAGKSTLAPLTRRLKQLWSLQGRCASTKKARSCSQRRSRVVQRKKGSAYPQPALHPARCAPLTFVLCIVQARSPHAHAGTC